MVWYCLAEAPALALSAASAIRPVKVLPETSFAIISPMASPAIIVPTIGLINAVVYNPTTPTRESTPTTV
jgi:hypothetical protein